MVDPPNGATFVLARRIEVETVESVYKNLYEAIAIIAPIEKWNNEMEMVIYIIL